MKQLMIVGLLALFSGFSACRMQNNTTATGSVDLPPVTANPQPENVIGDKDKTPVLVELFTSEGCSSCPPADRALAFLGKEQPYPEAEIVTLSMHVDYWDRLGWKDEFSSPLFTQRQESYAVKMKLDSTYTPQMVVDGSKQFVGSDSGAAAAAITEAAKAPKGKVEIAADGDKLSVKIADLPAHEEAEIFLAIAEDKLASNVTRGENSGKRLEHQSVVREFRSIGTIKENEKSAIFETDLSLNQKWNKQNTKIIVFVQEKESKRVLGLTKKSA